MLSSRQRAYDPNPKADINIFVEDGVLTLVAYRLIPNPTDENVLVADTSEKGTLGVLNLDMIPENAESITYLLDSEEVFWDNRDPEDWDGEDFWEADAYLAEGTPPKEVAEFHKMILTKV